VGFKRAEKGAEVQAIGRSRGGRTTKIHAAVDEFGCPRWLIIRPGHRGDAPVAAELVDGFKLARNFRAAVLIASIVSYWL
jgi:hypothetical protein